MYDIGSDMNFNRISFRNIIDIAIKETWVASIP